MKCAGWDNIDREKVDYCLCTAEVEGKWEVTAKGCKVLVSFPSWVIIMF